MQRKNPVLMALIALMALSLWGCGGSSSSSNTPTGEGDGEVIVDPQALFVGSETCQTCHPSYYADFIDSGHPYKLNKVVDGQVPTYPQGPGIAGALEQVTDAGSDSRIDKLNGDAPLADNGPETDNELGTPLSYDDVTYVIGGYGWKARWIDADGFIVTGTAVQYNLADGSMAGYHNDEANKVYNCGNCHTTGWRHNDAEKNANRQDNLPGMDGTFVAGGVHCESCHGPGAAHAASGDPADIVKVAEARTTDDFLADDMGYGMAVACSECHTRDGEKDYPSYQSGAQKAGYAGNEGGRIVSNGTTGKHHQQYDEMVGLLPEDYDVDGDGQAEAALTALGKKLNAGMTCSSCHDPHKSTKYDLGGVKNDCTDCHGTLPMPADSAMANLDCTSCHMPGLAKSAIWEGTNKAGVKVGDIKSHIFKIDLSKTDQLTDDKNWVYPWITADYACGSCHAVAGFGFDVAEYKFHQAEKWEPAAVEDFEGGDYVGSTTCGMCHSDKYAEFTDSGHPYKLNEVVDGQVPTYPFSDITGALEQVTDEDGVTDNSLGTPASYADVSYVIGGYGWKARWIDLDGFIVTGSAVQYNLEDGSMAGYHDNEVDKPYNCGNCHTTGWAHFDDTKNPLRQDNLPGMDGTFAETGIGCEACHGGGSVHVGSADKKGTITKVAAGRSTADFLADDMAYGRAVACGECHTRDGEKDYPTYLSGANNAGYTGDHGGRIVSNGTTAKHHEQYDELLGLEIDATGDLVNAENGGNALGKHLMFGVGCNSCHDPHKTVKYQDETGVAGVKDCSECHVSVGFNSAIVSTHDFTDCTTCHMPKLAKSAIWTGENAAGARRGDIKTHIFKIDLSKTAQLTDDSAFVYPWITPDYSCGECHSDTATKVNNLNNNYGGKIHQ